MANPFFQFKYFTVYHDRSSLKVSTDSCLFGAWIADKISGSQLAIGRALDIGAGTGLLMLMLAQRFAGNIDGIEIDQDSYEQATENIRTSSWHDRLHLFHHDIKLFELPHQYDLIISNPPFFEGDLKSTASKSNIAKHDEGLTLNDLLGVVDRNLTAKGKLAVLLPYHRMTYFEELAAGYTLFVSDKLVVRQTANHPYFRCCLLLTRKEEMPHTESLTIRETGDVYTERFAMLLKEYYLYL
jgi:tRNA1Val (adenine37-N6)-methyltransferase